MNLEPDLWLIEERHKAHVCNRHTRPGICPEDQQAWPCDTRLVLDALAAKSNAELSSRTDFVMARARWDRLRREVREWLAHATISEAEQLRRVADFMDAETQ